MRNSHDNIIVVIKMRKTHLRKGGGKMPEINLSFIRERRRELKLSQSEMAKSLKLRTPEKYSRRENGEYKFQAVELPILAQTLEVEIQDLYK